MNRSGIPEVADELRETALLVAERTTSKPGGIEPDRIALDSRVLVAGPTEDTGDGTATVVTAAEVTVGMELVISSSYSNKKMDVAIITNSR